MTNRILLLAVVMILAACEENHPEKRTEKAGEQTQKADTFSKPITRFTAAQTMEQPQIPILCYHRLREWKPTDTKSMKDYIVPVEKFRAQIKMLADSGYHTILPDQLYAYLTTGAALPSKPIMLTFDDSEEEHYTIAAAEMKKYGFKGVFFLMTVTMNRPGYLSREEIKTLSDEGHEIAAHTWNHNNVKKYQENDWEIQIGKPIRQIQSITGKPVKYFAYPFGLWNEQAIPHLKQYGFIAAFQLTGKRDPQEPLYTIRRMIIPGEWDNAKLYRWMKANF